MPDSAGNFLNVSPGCAGSLVGACGAFVAKFTASGTLTVGETGCGVSTNYLVVGGGGGAGKSETPAGAGGAGSPSTISGSDVQRGGGGGGGGYYLGTPGAGGAGGGGTGGAPPGGSSTGGQANTGGGAGGSGGVAAQGFPSQPGGSGVVYIRRLTADSCSTSGSTSTCGSDTIHAFTGDGTFVA